MHRISVFSKILRSMYKCQFCYLCLRTMSIEYDSDLFLLIFVILYKILFFMHTKLCDDQIV